MEKYLLRVVVLALVILLCGHESAFGQSVDTANSLEKYRTAIEFVNSNDDSKVEQAFALLAEAANDGVMEACATLAAIYEQNAMYPEAAEYYLKALDMSIVNSDDEAEVRNNYNNCRRGFFRVQLIDSTNAGTVPEKAIDMGLSVKWSNRNYKSTNIEKPGELLTQPEALAVDKNGYRLPTIAEWKELMDNCVWVPAEIRGISGFLVFGKGEGKTVWGSQPDNVLFLPGEFSNLEYTSHGRDGYYWSNEPDRCFTFYNDSVIDTAKASSDLKFCIRLVKE